MMSNTTISSSENALVINLEYAEIEEIIEKKFSWFLNHQKLPKADILRQFCGPVEQAVIEFGLSFCKCNQLKAARALGINRNTLRKKIREYNLNLKELLSQPYKKSYYPENRIFLSSISSLDLISACRAKLAVFYSKTPFPSEKALRSVCRPVEQLIIKKVLEHCKGNRMRASRLLGINRNTLKKKMGSKKNQNTQLT